MKTRAIYLFIFFWFLAAPAYGDNAMEYFNRGVKNSVTHKKIEYFTKALELNPALTEAYEKRGLLHYYQGNYDNVISDYHTYLDLAPAKAEAYRMLGMGYMKSGKYGSAIYHFSQAIKIDPKLTSAYAGRAEAYRLSGDDKKSIRDATEATKLRGDPRAQADAYKTRAKIYRRLGNVELAVADSRTAMTIDPRIPRFWGRRYFFRYASPEELSKAGLIALIAIALILVFKLTLKPPKK
jgi:tetratricopeptide (TPR) repeat protein